MPWRVRASGLHYIRCHTNFRHPFKLYVDGKAAIEIDKFNYVAKFGDTDILSSVRPRRSGTELMRQDIPGQSGDKET